MAHTASVLALVAVAAVAAAKPMANMNGHYILSPTANARNTSAFNTSYASYPNVDYFDVYSPPYTTLYSQVFWTMLDPVNIPQDVIDRFKGKTMAIVGLEVDQVRRTPQGDVSIPMNILYQHHFEATLTGANSVMEKIKLSDHHPELPFMGHRRPDENEAWVVRSLKPDSAIPTSQALGSNNNGGEYRKSFHGYAPPYVQLIDSPEKLYVTPMQIDTWNRDHMNLTGSKFVSGPVPRNGLAPTSGPDALYSSLLECPVTTRIRKIIDGNYSLQVAGNCADGEEIHTAEECWAAAASVNIPSSLNVTESVGSDPTLPAGCSLRITSPSQVSVFFNKAASSVGCGSHSAGLQGSASSLVSVNVQVQPSGVTLTLKGPADVWFGVGFNASQMKDAPWAVIVDGYGNVTERKLADQNPGAQLKSTVTVVSHSVAQGLRTVVLKRALVGPSAEYYTFSTTPDSAVLPFINAVGNGPQLSYHKSRTASSMVLLPINASACVCPVEPAPFGQGKGSLQYGSTTVGFGNKCEPQPRSDLLAQHNPTCDIRTYTGGQTACHHMWSLLDADQEIPWQDQPLTAYMKFRIWFQDYDPSVHVNVEHVTWGIASPVEYDVPQCPPGTPTAECIHTITGTFNAGGTKGKQMKLVRGNFHCHAPTCLNVSLYRQTSDGLELLCTEKPIYGGTGQLDDPRFDEPGYILQPPCIWGSPEQGLEAPVTVTDQTLHVIKHSNSTYGHHGEMAWLQMFYIEE